MYLGIPEHLAFLQLFLFYKIGNDEGDIAGKLVYFDLHFRIGIVCTFGAHPLEAHQLKFLGYQQACPLFRVFPEEREYTVLDIHIIRKPFGKTAG
jgi:hypothetical protein